MCTCDVKEQKYKIQTEKTHRVWCNLNIFLLTVDLKSLMMTFAARGETTSAFSLLNYIPRLSTGTADSSPDTLLLKQVIMSGQVTGHFFLVVY